MFPAQTPFGIYGATDTRTGKVVWKIRIPQPAKSGVLVAGDLVFFGEGNGRFDGVDAKTGEVLFTFDAPAAVTNARGAAAGPIAYDRGGRSTSLEAGPGGQSGIDQAEEAGGDQFGLSRVVL